MPDSTVIYLEVQSQDRLVSENGAPSAPGMWTFWLQAPATWVTDPALPTYARQATHRIYDRMHKELANAPYDRAQIKCWISRYGCWMPRPLPSNPGIKRAIRYTASRGTAALRKLTLRNLGW
jgi:hypothetical protein